MESVHIERFYLACLAHASYMVESGGMAAVIDPQRDVEVYIEVAAQRGWRIAYIIETHLHADFVSGHCELAARTGAQIYLGAGSGAHFPHVAVHDGDELQFGKCSLKFLQTPGHTVESICAVLTDVGEPAHPSAVFTGDTLFFGDVGRPDLSDKYSPQELAEMLYRNLHDKLLTLPDETPIYPAHGAGSLCGRQMSSETSSTIGIQRRSNYALLAGSSDEFVRMITDNLPVAPEYFAKGVDLNRRGVGHVSELPALPALPPEEVQRLQREGVVVLDTRSAIEFAAGHVPRSAHIALSGQFASWAARILGLHQPLVLVGEDAEHIRESRVRLARVGIEDVVGYLAQGVMGWNDAGLETESIPQATVQELAGLLSGQQTGPAVLDVREAAEIQNGAIQGSICIPLGQLPTRLPKLDLGTPLVVHCKGGYRSSVAASLLRQAGFTEVTNLIGGFDAWKAAGLPICVPQRLIT